MRQKLRANVGSVPVCRVEHLRPRLAADGESPCLISCSVKYVQNFGRLVARPVVDQMLAGREASDASCDQGNGLACIRKFANQPKPVNNLTDYATSDRFTDAIRPVEEYLL
jgi:hypothetical protein